MCLRGLASLEKATSQDLAFVNADKYLEQAAQSQAGALIVTAELKEQLRSQHNFIIVANPYLAFAILTHVLRKRIRIGALRVLHKFIHLPSLLTVPILDIMW